MFLLELSLLLFRKQYICIQSMTNLNSFPIRIIIQSHPLCLSISVLIVSSPLNSPAANRIINQYKHYQQTKILLIDIIGNVFNYENRLHKSLNTTTYNNLLVLTILTQRFKQVLSSKYHLEFRKYLNVKSAHLKQHSNATGSDSFCDLEKHNSSDYRKIASNFTSCQREIKERCHNYTNEDIKSFCTNIAVSWSRRRDDGEEKRFKDYTFNKQLVFSEHFNLFDFITSLSRDEKNASNHERRHQFDFIVLDFKSILIAANETIAFWRPLMILEQNEIDRNIFTMHRALSERDVFDEWMLPHGLWRCGTFCWSIIAGILLILLSFIVIISLSVGIAAR